MSLNIDQLSLYQQLQIFKQAGINIGSSTIGRRFKQLRKLLLPLYEVMIAIFKRTGTYRQAKHPLGTE